MQFQGVRPDLVKFEMRQATGTPAWQQEIKRPGGFGRFLSGIGRIFGAVAAPLSFIFPPAALAAAGMYGASSIGDQIQSKAYQNAMEAQAQRNPQNVSFPGLDVGGAAPFQPASTPLTQQNEMVMNVLFNRGNAQQAMTGTII